MSGSEQLLRRLPNDIGGLPAEAIQHVDHELKPWEKRCHALADVLDFHKINSATTSRVWSRARQTSVNAHRR